MTARGGIRATEEFEMPKQKKSSAKQIKQFPNQPALSDDNVIELLQIAFGRHFELHPEHRRAKVVFYDKDDFIADSYRFSSKQPSQRKRSA
jgi:hypothetical protein